MNCALITGASRGIGSAIALQLSKDHGLHIIINYSSDTDAANEILDKICNEGGTGELLQFKVQDKLDVDKNLVGWMERNPEKFIKVLVNNAGIAKDGTNMPPIAASKTIETAPKPFACSSVLAITPTQIA